jgi:hypothetical protein
MPEVHSVYATVRRPSGRDGDLGQVTEGYYTLQDGLLTMTDSAGVAVRKIKTGEKITHHVQPAEDARSVACRLTLQIYLSRRDVSDFNMPLYYPPSGVA